MSGLHGETRSWGKSLGALFSMTGFARVEGHDDGADWAWEVRSVNGRSLEIRCRVPAGLERLDAVARQRAAERLTRGNVNMTLSVSTARGSVGYQVNRALLAQVQGLATELGEAPPRLEALLGVRGLFEAASEPEDAATVQARQVKLLASLDEALAALVEARREEGARLSRTLETRLAALARPVEAAEGCAAAQPAAIRARLAKLVGELRDADPALPEERLAQEAALLVGKADVREELDRLAAHIAAVGDLLTAGGAVGRRLDFLCQELNREANTLCAKSADLGLTEMGLAMKAAVEQLREQVQNVE